MNFLHLFLFLFVGFVLTSAMNFADFNENVNFNDLVADVELNILFINNIISKNGPSELTNELKSLHTALSNFADALYKPEVMIHYCGEMNLKDPFVSKLLNRFQRDTINPFAEIVNYKALDETKFTIPFTKDLLQSSFIKSRTDLFTEFERLLQQDVKLFLNTDLGMTDGRSRRSFFKAKVEKFIIRRIRTHVIEKGIDAPKIFSCCLGLLELALSVYINNGL